MEIFPTPWSAPYHVVPDKNGEIWAGSMWTDRVTRLDPKTGQFTDYLLAPGDQHQACVRGQFDHAGHVLGGQQSRRFGPKAGTAGLAVRASRPGVRRSKGPDLS